MALQYHPKPTAQHPLFHTPAIGAYPSIVARSPRVSSWVPAHTRWCQWDCVSCTSCSASAHASAFSAPHASARGGHDDLCIRMVAKAPHRNLRRKHWHHPRQQSHLWRRDGKAVQDLRFLMQAILVWRWWALAAALRPQPACQRTPQHRLMHHSHVRCLHGSLQQKLWELLGSFVSYQLAWASACSCPCPFAARWACPN